jgi:hypothetical protein
MAIQNSKTRIAAAVGAAAFGAGLTAPAGAVVVVGGDNGWEVSFDGNVNAFYTVGDYDQGYVSEAADKTSSRVHSGFLPAFFSFNVKSPTIDGMTGSARISFAPTIQTGGTKTQFSSQSGNVGPVPGIGGATIDTREVVANLSGAFGEVSFGRTLSLFGRNAILNDMTLFGVGFAPGADSFGSDHLRPCRPRLHLPGLRRPLRSTPPRWSTASSSLSACTTRRPSPASPPTTRRVGGTGSLLDESRHPALRGRGQLLHRLPPAVTSRLWADGLWQDTELELPRQGLRRSTAGANAAQCGDISTRRLGRWVPRSATRASSSSVTTTTIRRPGPDRAVQPATQCLRWTPAATLQRARRRRLLPAGHLHHRHGKTKVGVSYGEGNLQSIDDWTWASTAANGVGTHVERQLWTVGVYHDVSSWLRLIAEYNRGSS